MDLPVEPRVPGRFRRVWLAVVVVAVFVPLAYGVFRVVTTGESFDPSLDGDIPADVSGEVDENPVVDPTG